MPDIIHILYVYYVQLFRNYVIDRLFIINYRMYIVYYTIVPYIRVYAILYTVL